MQCDSWPDPMLVELAELVSQVSFSDERADHRRSEHWTIYAHPWPAGPGEPTFTVTIQIAARLRRPGGGEVPRPEAPARLHELLVHHDPDVRWAAARSLACFERSGDAADRRPAPEDPSGAEPLADPPRGRVDEVLMRLGKEGDWRLRELSCVTWFALPQSSQRLLERMLGLGEDENPYVRRAATCVARAALLRGQGIRLALKSGKVVRLPSGSSNGQGQVSFRDVPFGDHRAVLVSVPQVEEADVTQAQSRRPGQSSLTRGFATSTWMASFLGDFGAAAGPGEDVSEEYFEVAAAATPGDRLEAEGLTPADEGPCTYILPDTRVTARIEEGPAGLGRLVLETEAAELEGTEVRYQIGPAEGVLHLVPVGHGRWGAAASLTLFYTEALAHIPDFRLPSRLR